MSRTRYTALPDQIRQAGTYPSQSVQINANSNISYAGVAMERKNWTDLGTADVISLSAEISINDGANWFSIGGCTASAQANINKLTGLPATEADFIARLPYQYIGTTFLARVILVAFAQVRGAVEIILDDKPVGIQPAHASVAYDNDGEATTGSATSITVSSLTIGNNSNRYLIVGAAGYPAPTISSVSWNGSTTGFAEKIADTHSVGQEMVAIWGLLNPTATTASVVVTFSGTVEGGLNALSVYNVDQSTPLGTPASNQGLDNENTRESVTVSTATGEMVYDVVLHYPVTDTMVVGPSQTELSNLGTASFDFLASRQNGVDGGLMTWTGGSAANEWQQCAIPIKEFIDLGGPSAAHWARYRLA